MKNTAIIITILLLFGTINLIAIDTNYRIIHKNELTLNNLYAHHDVRESYNINGNSITSKSLPFLNLNYKRLYYFNDNFNIGFGAGFSYERIIHQFSLIENGVQLLPQEDCNLISNQFFISVPLILSYEIFLGKKRKQRVETHIGYIYSFRVSELLGLNGAKISGNNTIRHISTYETHYYSSPSQHAITGGIGYIINNQWKIGMELWAFPFETPLAYYTIRGPIYTDYELYAEGDIYKSQLYFGLSLSYRFNFLSNRKKKRDNPDYQRVRL